MFPASTPQLAEMGREVNSHASSIGARWSATPTRD
jgi:hypothetical protein